MNLYSGHQLRLERQRLRLSLHTLAALADCVGASAQRLSNYECGGRLADDVISRVEYVLESVDRMKNAFPFSLDTRDAASMKAALAAFERRDERFFSEREAAAVPNPNIPIAF